MPESNVWSDGTPVLTPFDLQRDEDIDALRGVYEAARDVVRLAVRTTVPDDDLDGALQSLAIAVHEYEEYGG